MSIYDDYDDPFDNAPFEEEDFFEREVWEDEDREYDPEMYWDESDEHRGDYF
ncbi:hypothetical protein ACH6EH_11495 [Paenibacillus sp. JSM ZJ436]|uniref:hypothetical protein n=1 Tax=Paenibacillus sp. JSM ZJ436 TaxID=3376190 RepID=UPI0037B03379